MKIDILISSHDRTQVWMVTKTINAIDRWKGMRRAFENALYDARWGLISGQPPMNSRERVKVIVRIAEPRIYL